MRRINEQIGFQHLHLRNVDIGKLAVIHVVSYLLNSLIVLRYLMMHCKLFRLYYQILISDHLCLYVSAAVRHNHRKSGGMDQEVDVTIKRWLHLAPDRDGGRLERLRRRWGMDNSH